MPEAGATRLRHCARRGDCRAQQRHDQGDDPHTLVRFSSRGKLEVDAAVVILLRSRGQVKIGESNFLAMSAGQVE
jgi:hypothetical protein